MQTTIFKQLAHNKAEAMLNHINEQRTGKEKFVLSCCADMGTLILYMAVNDEQQHVFNILDDQGNTPHGMSANWRTWNHIAEDLK